MESVTGHNVHSLLRGLTDLAAIIGGAVVAFFQMAGPIISGVSGLVAITWGGFSLYYLVKDHRKQ